MINHTTSTQCRMKYYVYQLRAINSDTPFYIGKGSGGRSKSHFSETQNGKKSFPQYNAIQSYWDKGVAVVDEILFYTSDEQLAFKVERAYIESYSEQIVNQRKTVADYHPKNNRPQLSFPRLLSRSPFSFHYRRHWRNKYYLHTNHEAISDHIAMAIKGIPVKLIMDDQCVCLSEVMFK